MKRIVVIVILGIVFIPARPQGFGFGYYADFGGSTYSMNSVDYFQSIGSISQNCFIRFHNETGHSAVQFFIGYRHTFVQFQNFSDFLSEDGFTLLAYNSDARLKLEAWKFGILKQFQFGRPGRMVFSFNTGLYCENTVSAYRTDNSGNFNYSLSREIDPFKIGGILGAEVRLYCFTIGYKAEKLFGDVLDHNYIIGQRLSLDNSSELRGLRLNPWMNYLYLGINLDFFCRKNIRKDKD